jgi:enoyl-CoA hydratase
MLITIDRPGARNSIDDAVTGDLHETMDRLDDDPELRAGVITGAGGVFCAGMDLKAFARGELSRTSRGFAGMTTRPSKKPLVAAVEGFAVGGGLEIALSCDLIVAAEDATLGIPEVKVGQIAAAGGLVRLPAQLPYRLATEMALTGVPIDAARAFEHGLVNRLVPPGEALPVALKLAETIAANAPLSVAISKEILSASPTGVRPEHWDRVDEGLRRILDSDDAKEGAAAFLERRAPRWQGT